MEHLDKIPISSEELYRRFLTGDSDSFEKLIELYENELLLFINGFVRDYHEAKQLAMETFTQLIFSGGQFSNKSSFKTYLFTIGKNLAFRYIKTLKNGQYFSYEKLIGIIADNETPYHFIEKEEDKQYLYKSMQELKPEYRIVLELLYFEDMSYLKAGQIMKKSEKQITNLAYRAKIALKKKLESSGFVYSSI